MRELCHRCRRPVAACFCRKLPKLSTRTRVVFLQHPREAKVPVGTARLAHLALEGSELHLGVEFDRHPRVRELAQSGEAALLFPADNARPLSSYVGAPPKTLFVVDGTWPQARKVVKKSALLQGLPKIAFTPERPGNYRIRKEPSLECVSTIEAVVEVLGALEEDRQRFLPMLDVFDAMVDLQIDCRRNRTGPPRRKLYRRERVLPAAVGRRYGSLVLVTAEANAEPTVTRGFDPELVHLAAVRPSSGERFEAVIAPRLPLRENTPHHLRMSAEVILAGEPLAAALERFRRFLREGDVLGCWAHFAIDLLAQEGFAVGETFDVRRAAADRLHRRPGGSDKAAQVLFGGVLEPLAQGRAGARLGELQAIVLGLRGESRAG